MLLRWQVQQPGRPTNNPKEPCIIRTHNSNNLDILITMGQFPTSRHPDAWATAAVRTTEVLPSLASYPSILWHTSHVMYDATPSTHQSIIRGYHCDAENYSYLG